VAVSDYRTALAVLKDEAELLKLYPPKRVETSGPDGGPLVVVEMTDDERASAVAAILARVGAGQPGPTPDGAADASGCPVGQAGKPDDPGGDDAGFLADDLPALGG
jgi:hypothetical protein